MSKPITRLWFLGPPAAILISLFVYYWKFATVRDWVDQRFPWVEENIGQRLQPIGERAGTRPLAASPGKSAAAPHPAEQLPERVSVFATPAPPPSFVGPDGRVDLDRLAADKPAWPKAVRLKKATEFPAVVNGKAVGKVSVPAGTETKLVAIQQGKLGLEYQGGGAWMPVEETDLADRLRR